MPCLRVVTLENNDVAAYNHVQLNVMQWTSTQTDQSEPATEVVKKGFQALHQWPPYSKCCTCTFNLSQTTLGENLGRNSTQAPL